MIQITILNKGRCEQDDDLKKSTKKKKKKNDKNTQGIGKRIKTGKQKKGK